MAILAHLLRPVPAARRAYSVFSKPGGGRYFNSAKPPKVAPTSHKGTADVSSTSNDASQKDQQPPGPSMTTEGLASTTVLPSPISAAPIHPSINPHDFKLHQFFSLHRPLLLMSQPPSSLFESVSVPFTLPPKSASETARLDSLEEPPEASPEEDADAARQLARALVVNRVGASLSWEKTLQQLGLDMTKGRAEEVKMAEEEFQVYMDKHQEEAPKEDEKA